MKRSLAWFVTAAICLSVAAQAQQPGAGASVRMETAAPSPQAGCFVYPQSHFASPFHTNYVLFSKDCKTPLVMAEPVPNEVAGPTATSTNAQGLPLVVTTYQVAEDPSSLGCLYVKSPSYAGCSPTDSVGNLLSGGPSSAGYGAIVIVDAFDNPNAATDLATFDTRFGLAAPPSFNKVFANGNGSCTTPAVNSGWALEESLDIEWAHVFAPKAAIVLVEACSSSSTDLMYAEQVAFNYIITNFKGVGGQVSNSWGGPESGAEFGFDPFFNDSHYSAYTSNTHIQAVASAGDSGVGAQYPSVSPWVVSAGGTSILRYTTGTGQKNFFYQEACWSSSGGGSSQLEVYQTTWTGGDHMGPWANYQAPLFGYTLSGSPRGTPDMSFDADPASGAYVFSQTGAGGWTVVGGTSLSAPALAGIINRAGNKMSSWAPFNPAGSTTFTARENNLLYAHLSALTTYKANFYDVTTGSNGAPAKAGWDFCTGVGSPRGLAGK